MSKHKDKKKEQINEEKNNEELKDELDEKLDELKEDVLDTADEITLLNEQLKDLEDKIVRSNAELINYRKRKDEETTRMLKYANEDLVLEILPVIDNFERAIMMDDDNLEDEVSKFLSGFKMIYGNLISILEKFEVKVINPIGEEFDPSFHQAVLTDAIEDKEDNIVLEVLQKGYILKDKVIRPAMVKVNKK